MKVGSFTQVQEPNRNRFTGRTSSSLFRPERMATSVTGTVYPWRGQALAKVGPEVEWSGLSLIDVAYRYRQESIGGSGEK
jgi:hypothetical protein